MHISIVFEKDASGIHILSIKIIRTCWKSLGAIVKFSDVIAYEIQAYV